jgi:hypothetical protein
MRQGNRIGFFRRKKTETVGSKNWFGKQMVLLPKPKACFYGSKETTSPSFLEEKRWKTGRETE